MCECVFVCDIDQSLRCAIDAVHWKDDWALFVIFYYRCAWWASVTLCWLPQCILCVRRRQHQQHIFRRHRADLLTFVWFIMPLKSAWCSHAQEKLFDLRTSAENVALEFCAVISKRTTTISSLFLYIVAITDSRALVKVLLFNFNSSTNRIYW